MCHKHSVPGQWHDKFPSTLHPCHAGVLGLRILGVVSSRRRRSPDNPVKEIEYGFCEKSATLISVPHRSDLNASGHFATLATIYGLLCEQSEF